MTTMSEKPHGADRVLTLSQIDGTKPLSSTGLVDKRLFTGENKLHAIMSPSNLLWTLKYEQGAVPPPLRDKSWTSFPLLMNDTRAYFKSRNIDIIQVTPQ